MMKNDPHLTQLVPITLSLLPLNRLCATSAPPSQPSGADVLLNILVSYLHFSDLVRISYEVFELTVKRSKGKSIRGAK